MRIHVTHLTRREQGFICVAGQREGSGESIRPVMPGNKLPRALFGAAGGPFRLGALVDLGETRPVGSPPQTEDYAFDPRNARAQGELDATGFWRLLERRSTRSLQEIFGPEMQPIGQTAALPSQKGKASLGILRPAARPTLGFYNNSPKLCLDAGGSRLSVAITDIRVFQPDHKTLDQTALGRLKERLASEDCLLAVGVGGAWGEGPSHWLQINGIHFASAVDWSDPLTSGAS